jgi:hypothetical protein
MEAKDIVEASAILDASNLGVKRNLWERGTHFLFDFEQRRLGDIEANDPGRVKARNLAAKFRADRSRRAGNEDDSAFECAADLIFFEAYWCSAQKILYRHFPNLANQATIFDHLAQPRNSQAFRSSGMAQFQNPGHCDACS